MGVIKVRKLYSTSFLYEREKSLTYNKWFSIFCSLKIINSNMENRKCENLIFA